MKFIGDKETTDIISTKSYLGTLLLGTLPIVGTILLIKWSKDSEVRVSKQNLCKAYLIAKWSLIVPMIAIAAVFGYIVNI